MYSVSLKTPKWNPANTMMVCALDLEKTRSVECAWILVCVFVFIFFPGCCTIAWLLCFTTTTTNWMDLMSWRKAKFSLRGQKAWGNIWMLDVYLNHVYPSITVPHFTFCMSREYSAFIWFQEIISLNTPGIPVHLIRDRESMALLRACGISSGTISKGKRMLFLMCLAPILTLAGTYTHLTCHTVSDPKTSMGPLTELKLGP